MTCFTRKTRSYFRFAPPPFPGTKPFQTFPHPRARRAGLVPGVAREGMVTGKIEPCITFCLPSYLQFASFLSFIRQVTRSPLVGIFLVFLSAYFYSQLRLCTPCHPDVLEIAWRARCRVVCSSSPTSTISSTTVQSIPPCLRQRLPVTPPVKSFATLGMRVAASSHPGDHNLRTY